MLYSDLLKSCLVLCKSDKSLVLALFELSTTEQMLLHHPVGVGVMYFMCVDML